MVWLEKVYLTLLAHSESFVNALRRKTSLKRVGGSSSVAFQAEHERWT